MKKGEVFKKHLECVAILAELTEEFILSSARDCTAVRARSAIAELCRRDGMNDAEIGVFLKRDRTAITHLRNRTIPSFSHDTLFNFYVDSCYVQSIAM